MRNICLALLYMLFSYGLKAQCDIEQQVFKAGEKLTYKAFYNWHFVWLEAADVEFTVERKKNDDFYRLTSMGNSLPKYDWMYKVRDTFRSHVDTATLRPYWYHRNTREGSYRVNNQYWFNYTKNVAYTNTDNSDYGKAQDTIKLPGCTFDVLSAIYYTRSLNFENRVPGEKIPITFLIDNELFDLYIRYLGKEQITTRNGDVYRCVKFNILLVEGTVFKGGENMTVWATDDKNHIPVLVKAEILIGSVKAYLTRFRNIKYTLDAWMGREE